MTEATVFYVRDFASNVASTRRSGREVASHIERLGREGPLVINFGGVEAASPPFMQEVVQAARSLPVDVEYADLDDDVADTLAFVESRLDG